MKALVIVVGAVAVGPLLAAWWAAAISAGWHEGQLAAQRSRERELATPRPIKVHEDSRLIRRVGRAQ